MKQQITKKQWDEITEEQQDYLILQSRCFDKEEIKKGSHRPIRSMLAPHICQMIEYLGEDLSLFITQNPSIVHFEDAPKRGIHYLMTDIHGLCDGLWEQVKHKLNNNRYFSRM